MGTCTGGWLPSPTGVGGQAVLSAEELECASITLWPPKPLRLLRNGISARTHARLMTSLTEAMESVIGYVTLVVMSGWLQLPIGFAMAAAALNAIRAENATAAAATLPFMRTSTRF